MNGHSHVWCQHVHTYLHTYDSCKHTDTHTWASVQVRQEHTPLPSRRACACTLQTCRPLHLRLRLTSLRTDDGSFKASAWHVGGHKDSQWLQPQLWAPCVQFSHHSRYMKEVPLLCHLTIKAVSSGRLHTGLGHMGRVGVGSGPLVPVVRLLWGPDCVFFLGTGLCGPIISFWNILHFKQELPGMYLWDGIFTWGKFCLELGQGFPTGGSANLDGRAAGHHDPLPALRCAVSLHFILPSGRGSLRRERVC